MVFNFRYEITYLETQQCYFSAVYCNSDLIATSPVFYAEKESKAWADGFIAGIKYIRGE